MTYIYMGKTFGLDAYVPGAALSQAKEMLMDNMDREQTAHALGFMAVMYLISFFGLL